MDVKRGDIFLADFSTGKKREEKPVLVVQNDMSNKYSETTIVAAVPDFLTEKLLPTHIDIPKDASNLGRDVIVLAEHLTTIKKSRLKKFIARIADEYMEEVEKALKISLSLE